MPQIITTPSFDRLFKKLSQPERAAVIQGITKFSKYILEGEVSMGLGITKLTLVLFEFRAGLKIRVIYRKYESDDYLVYLGNHDEISRFLRESRAK